MRQDRENQRKKQTEKQANSQWAQSGNAAITHQLFHPPFAPPCFLSHPSAKTTKQHKCISRMCHYLVKCSSSVLTTVQSGQFCSQEMLCKDVQRDNSAHEQATWH